MSQHRNTCDALSGVVQMHEYRGGGLALDAHQAMIKLLSKTSPKIQVFSRRNVRVCQTGCGPQGQISRQQSFREGLDTSLRGQASCSSLRVRDLARCLGRSSLVRCARLPYVWSCMCPLTLQCFLRRRTSCGQEQIHEPCCVPMPSGGSHLPRAKTIVCCFNFLRSFFVVQPANHTLTRNMCHQPKSYVQQEFVEYPNCVLIAAMRMKSTIIEIHDVPFSFEHPCSRTIMSSNKSS